MTRQKRNWSVEEDALLIEASSLFILKELTQLFECSPDRIKSRCRELDITWIDGRTTDEFKKKASIITTGGITVLSTDNIIPGTLRSCPGPLHNGAKVSIEMFDWNRSGVALREQCRECWSYRGKENNKKHREKNKPEGWAPKRITSHEPLQCDGISHICTGCGIRKEFSEFHAGRGPCGFSSRCKRCIDDAYLRRTFEISIIDFEWLLHNQNGVCRWCDKPETVISKNGVACRLSVEHYHGCCGDDHGCKRCIRALVCKSCNASITALEHNPVFRKFVTKDFEEYLLERPYMSTGYIEWIG